MNYLLVALGGMAGSLLRFGLVNIFNTSSFAYGTLLANSLGSLLVGVFFVAINEKALLSEGYRLALIIGFCGSLTTLSTISLDTIQLFNSGEYYLSVTNLLTNIILSIVFVVLGMYLTHLVH